MLRLHSPVPRGRLIALLFCLENSLPLNRGWLEVTNICRHHLYAQPVQPPSPASPGREQHRASRVEKGMRPEWHDQMFCWLGNTCDCDGLDAHSLGLWGLSHGPAHPSTPSIPTGNEASSSPQNSHLQAAIPSSCAGGDSQGLFSKHMWPGILLYFQ